MVGSSEVLIFITQLVVELEQQLEVIRPTPNVCMTMMMYVYLPI